MIGDRAYGGDPARAARLGRAACEGLLAGGVLPTIKHIPGHGRARIDSHKALPGVETPAAELAQTDFVPFRALADMPWAMTAHVVYAALDPDRPATLSRSVIDTVIRGEIGFDGMLVSDDVNMGALTGAMASGSRASLAAGCDAVLHCSGVLSEMREAATAAPPLTPAAMARIARGEALRRGSVRDFDRREAEMRFEAMTRALAGMIVDGHLAAMIKTATTWVVPVIFAVTFHEAAHGFVALRFGDDTALRAGRVSINPLNHIDLFGTMLLPLLLMLTLGLHVRLCEAGAS